MGVFFGTDGIRGEIGKSINGKIAYNCGRALSKLKKNATILIGKDTRTSGNSLTISFVNGAVKGGARVVDVGVCPTAGIAFLTTVVNADYGVVVSASHNPPNWNGIKIFNAEGKKLSQTEEEEIEKQIAMQTEEEEQFGGEFTQRPDLTDIYMEYLCNCTSVSLKGLKIALDCSNGASFKIAPKVFKNLGAEVVLTACEDDGGNINVNCGSLHPQNLMNLVLSSGADMGFAFDGDADRIVAVDEKGNELDGDVILYMIAMYLKEKGQLKNNTIVGTHQTNSGIESALNDVGVKMERTNIGDKYVIDKLNELNLSLGGEKSGHIILRDFSTTADGILAGVLLAEIVKQKKLTLSEYSGVYLLPQTNLNCEVNHKNEVIQNKELNDVIALNQKMLGKDARILVRVSGTENKIRIMVECSDPQIADQTAHKIEQVVNEINNES